MKSFLPARRRGSVVVALTAGAVVTALVVEGFGTDSAEIESTASVSPAPAIVLTQMDGTPPFDSNAAVGGDSGPSNGIVRSGDRVAFVLDIDHGSAGIADATVTLPIWKGLTLDAVPEFCRPGSDLFHVGAMSVLTCALGDLAPHQRTTRAVSVGASSASVAPGATITTSATLSGISPITFVMSNATRLQFAPKPAGCDPRDIEVALDPAIRPDPDAVRANGRIADVVVDESGVPVPGAVVTLTGEDRCGDIIDRSIAAGENGHFAFVGLVAGNYRVTASTPPHDPSEPRPTTTATVALSEPNMIASALDLRLVSAEVAASETSR